MRTVNVVYSKCTRPDCRHTYHPDRLPGLSHVSTTLGKMIEAEALDFIDGEKRLQPEKWCRAEKELPAKRKSRKGRAKK